MTDAKKFLTTMGVLVVILLMLLLGINILMSNLLSLLSSIINIFLIIFISTIVFSIVITYMVLKDKKVNNSLMKINLNIFRFLYPLMVGIAELIKISKNEIRKVYVKLNNTYIYNSKYNLKSEEILILLPHCIQKSKCKLKVTSDVTNCKQCGLCNVGDLVSLQDKYNVKVFIATGGTLARKIIIETRPKAVIAVACERDLTAGIQDISKIPVLGVFNERPNGPCVDTIINVQKVEEAIKFLLGEC